MDKAAAKIRGTYFEANVETVTIPTRGEVGPADTIDNVRQTLDRMLEVHVRTAESPLPIITFDPQIPRDPLDAQRPTRIRFELFARGFAQMEVEICFSRLPASSELGSLKSQLSAIVEGALTPVWH